MRLTCNPPDLHKSPLKVVILNAGNISINYAPQKTGFAIAKHNC